MLVKGSMASQQLQKEEEEVDRQSLSTGVTPVPNTCHLEEQRKARGR